MKRLYREMPNSTKEKISQAMKNYHANKSDIEKEKTRIKRSNSMREYWKNIPSKEDCITD